MRAYIRPLLAIFAAATFGAASHADVKNVPYPEVKVELSKSYKPDAAFEKMRVAFAAAAAKKDGLALFALVGSTFVWTASGEMVEKFDLGRNAIHNFKVVFGFRNYGKDADGGVEDGPYWDALAAFATDPTYFQANDTGSLICGPMAAEIADDEVYEQAREKIETDDDVAEWYFTLAETAVARAPGAAGPPIAKLGRVAVPVLDVFPQVQEGKPAQPTTHLQVLLPSGKTGWIPASAARPLNSNQLCYAKTAAGDWKIVGFDESE
jgi:hypothetical protein